MAKEDQSPTAQSARDARTEAHEKYLAENSVSHAQRMIEAIDKGLTLSGVRLTEKDKPENGMVVTLTPEEAEPVVAAVKKALRARR